jgi:hypothetical protein
MNVPPKELFEGGSKTLSVEVRVCIDEFGTVWSFHQLSTEDEKKASSYPGGGTQQIGHALLVETVRRETFNSALVLLESEPTFLQTWTTADETVKKELEEKLATAIHGVIERTTRRLCPSSVKEILSMLEQQKIGKNDGT